jgi:hypothetical protein
MDRFFLLVFIGIMVAFFVIYILPFLILFGAAIFGAAVA